MLYTINKVSHLTLCLNIFPANSTSLLAIPYQEHSPYSLLVDLEESIKYCGDRQDQGKKFSQAPNFSPMENESNLDETDYFDSSQEASEIIGKGSRVQSNPIQQRDPQRQNQAVQNSRESLKATSSTLSNEAPSRKRSVGKNLIKLSQLQGDSTNHDVARLSQTRPFFRPSVANIDNSRSIKINQRLRGTNRHKEQEKMQGSEEGLQSDDDNVSKNTVKGKKYVKVLVCVKIINLVNIQY